ncbi:HD domain-containing protein [Candidatus Bathyarchaeota archaeon]|nr:HD domain-containing protein [Candidatus Bathyarchaeota archaeon]
MPQDPRQIERYRGVVKFLDNATKNIALYPAQHPSVQGIAKRAHDLLGEVFEGKDEVLIGVINGVLYVDDYLFYESTPYSDSFLKIMSGFGIDDLLIAKGVTVEELLQLVDILKIKERNRELFLKKHEEAGLQNIGLKSFTMGREDADLPTRSLETYRDAISTMNGFFDEVGDGQLPPLREAENLVEGFMDKLSTNKSLLMLLSSLKGYDAYTYQHCVNVGILSLLLAEKEGLDEQKIKWAALAGMMHDIGKVKIPETILNKPGGLTMREGEAIKAHPVHSAEVIRGMGGADGLAHAVEGHHMHHDGGGYPIVAETDGPTVLAKLVSVVDAYDAITTVRSYKKPMTPLEAMTFLEQGRGTRFDPYHVDAFISMVGAYPPGAMVRLSSNEIRVVVEAGEKPGRPTVKMIVDEKGKPFSDQWELDLDGSEAQGRMVAAVIDPALHDLRAEHAFD